jgi:hypothetical protein
MRMGPVFLTFGQHRGPPSGRDLLGYNPWVMHEDKVGYWSLFDENLPCGYGKVRTSNTGWLAPPA